MLMGEEEEEKEQGNRQRRHESKLEITKNSVGTISWSLNSIVCNFYAIFSFLRALPCNDFASLATKFTVVSTLTAMLT